MFEVGDRVAVVNDRPVIWNGKAYDLGIRQGEVFVVLRVFPVNPQAGWSAPKSQIGISIGRDNQYYLAILKELPPGYPRPEGPDAWGAHRFRKLRDISQSLRELKELAINCPALVEP